MPFSPWETEDDSLTRWETDEQDPQFPSVAVPSVSDLWEQTKARFLKNCIFIDENKIFDNLPPLKRRSRIETPNIVLPRDLSEKRERKIDPELEKEINKSMTTLQDRLNAIRSRSKPQ